MKKTLKSQLFVAIAMVVIATIALTSASYAWFTSIANPEVKTIDLYVKAADTIMLSAYDNDTSPNINYNADWKATILQTDITNPDWATGDKWGAQATAFPSFTTGMLNVSSLFNETNNKFYTANHSALGVISGYTLTGQVGNFAKFSLWAKSTRDGYIYLDGTDLTGSTVTGLTPGEPGNSISKTVRVAFVPVNDTVEDWTNAVIWEPNSTTHLNEIYGGTATDGAKSPTTAIDNTSLVQTATQDTFDFQDADTNILASAKTSEYGVKPEAGLNDPSKIALFNINKDTPTNFNVYIWVEGADVDTLNAVAKNAFSTYLKFGQEFDKTITRP